MSNNILGGIDLDEQVKGRIERALGGNAAGLPYKKEATLEETYRQMIASEMQASQITAIPPLVTGVVATPQHDVLRIERSVPQKIVITLEKIDNGFIASAYDDKSNGGLSTELFKSFIEDPTNLGEVAIKALAIAGLSK